MLIRGRVCALRVKRAVLVFPGATRVLVEQCVAPDSFVVAVDAGAEALRAAGRSPDILVGDLDSVSSDALAWVRAQGARVEKHAPEKDFTDGALALDLVRDYGEVTFLGGGGARVDHALGNLHLLYRASLSARACAIDADSRAWFATPGRPVELELPVGTTVSVLPFLGDASGVTYDGLRFGLTNVTLRAGQTRGISNVASLPTQRIEVATGALLVVAPTLG